MLTHPKTGFHYIHVFRPHDPFIEIRGCFRNAAEKLGWMSVQEDTEWQEEKSEWHNPENFIIFWGFEKPILPENRKALFGIRYLESVGDPKGLIGVQQQCITNFFGWAKVPDVVFVATPSACDFLRPYCRRIAALPSGYDPDVMGKPDWSIRKTYDIAIYGHEVGRRWTILKDVRKRFGNKILTVTGYGLERKRAVESARCVLYVGHSEEVGFPGMRLWQMVATSTALIAERRDVWPADPTKHLIQLDPVNLKKVHAFCERVKEALKGDVSGIARAAHQDLSLYTAERCMEEFVIPATMGLREA